MINLAEYRRKSHCLADFLPWAALVDKGVILNKDGSFQRTARFRGPDLDSATPGELVAITARLNNALRRLGFGWRSSSKHSACPPIATRKANFPTRRLVSSTPNAVRSSRVSRIGNRSGGTLPRRTERISRAAIS